MNRSFLIVGALVALLSAVMFLSAGPAAAAAAPAKATDAGKGAQAMLEKIHWLGHDCFRIDAEKVVYFDPFELGTGLPPADIILVSHDHFDHCSPADVAAVTKNSTVIVTNTACAKKLKGDIKVVKPGDKLTVQGVSIEVVPAYNVDPARTQYHPRSAGGVGFIVTLGKTRIYHAGDTDLIPEMSNLKVDIAMLPVSGKYVMTPQDAAKAVKVLKPEITIPMHYGSIVGSRADADTLKKLVAPYRVEILTSEKKK